MKRGGPTMAPAGQSLPAASWICVGTRPPPFAFVTKTRTFQVTGLLPTGTMMSSGFTGCITASCLTGVGVGVIVDYMVAVDVGGGAGFRETSRTPIFWPADSVNHRLPSGPPR